MNEIVIGADSKVTDTFGNDLNKRQCKILQVGSLFLAFEGLEFDSRTGFNVPEIATAALQIKPSAPAVQRVSILTGVLISRLFDELPQLKKLAPETYQKKIEGGQMFLKILVAGFEKGRPLVFVRNFKGVLINAQQFGITVVRDDCLEDCRGDVVTRYLGEIDAIDGLPEDNPGFWKSGLVAGVRRLIETAILARSEYVGPPIDIVRIDQSGAHWIQRKPECLEAPKRPGRAKRS
jgi:hypothetical protein